MLTVVLSLVEVVVMRSGAMNVRKSCRHCAKLVHVDGD